MQITIDDLFVLEPHLTRNPALAEVEAEAESATEVSWAISARSTEPHLPPLRGGELVLVARNVSETLGLSLVDLYRQAAARGVSALVLEERDPRLDMTYPMSTAIPLLVWHGALQPETETAINRRLTERRSALYRVGSELERRLTDLAVSQAGLAAFVTVAAEATALPMAVTGADERCLAAAPQDNPLCTDGSIPEPLQVVRELPLGAMLRLGPLQPEQRLLARFVADRIATAAAAALRRDEAARPRGAQRAQVMAELLSGRYAASEQRSAALALGLDLDATYIVAIGRGVAADALARGFSSLGEIHPAGDHGNQRTVLIASSRQRDAQTLSARVAAIAARWQADHATAGAVALSSLKSGITDLPDAAREARFIAALQRRGTVSRPVASFLSTDDLGAMGLLYHWRDSRTLREFVAATLGALEEHDSRGTLRATLRAFLASGGSQVDAAHALGIHRNTLASRLRRLNELLERDVADPATWLPVPR